MIVKLYSWTRLIRSFSFKDKGFWCLFPADALQGVFFVSVCEHGLLSGLSGSWMWKRTQALIRIWRCSVMKRRWRCTSWTFECGRFSPTVSHRCLPTTRSSSSNPARTKSPGLVTGTRCRTSTRWISAQVLQPAHDGELVMLYPVCKTTRKQHYL